MGVGLGELSSDGGRMWGLAEGSGGVLGPPACSFVLGLTSGVGERASLASIAVSLLIGVAVDVGVGHGRPCSLALGLASESGGRALLVWGAVSPAIEAAAGLAVVGASWGDACACAGLVVGEGSGGGLWSLSDRRDGASFASFGSMLVSPLLTFVCFLSFPLSCSFLSSFSILSSCSVPLTPLCSCCWLLVSCVTRCARLASRASRRVLTVANVVSI